MFLDELSPMMRELTQHPTSFLGGFFSGLLRLNLADDPVKSWLNQQSGEFPSTASSYPNGHNGGSNGGPQAISID